MYTLRRACADSIISRGASVLYTDTPPAVIYTLSLHDALPISAYENATACPTPSDLKTSRCTPRSSTGGSGKSRSEEHTSELQSPDHPVCRLLPAKKNIETRSSTLPLGRNPTSNCFPA